MLVSGYIWTTSRRPWFCKCGLNISRVVGLAIRGAPLPGGYNSIGVWLNKGA